MAAQGLWLLKSEPDVFSFTSLLRSRDRRAPWDGVRNYQVRNMMRDQFRCEDRGFFYHSSTDEPAVVGTVKIVREAYPDTSALKPGHMYFDELSFRRSESQWLVVDVAAEEQFDAPVTLKAMRTTPGLEDMLLLRRGMRLSIQPVTAQHWDIIYRLGRPKAVGAKVSKPKTGPATDRIKR